MAPQLPQPTTRKAPAPPQLTQQDHLDNDDALVGTTEDELIERGGSHEPRQGQDRDDDGGSPRNEKIQKSPQDDMRSRIAARFRRAEPENERPFNGDMSDPENLYGEFGQGVDDEEYDRLAEARAPARPGKPTTLAEPGPTDGDDEDEDLDPNQILDLRPGRDVRQPQQQDQPRMITRLVRGKNVTKSEDEWLELASKVEAADSYLAETRELLKDARGIRASRVAQDGQHPDRQNDTQDDGLELDQPGVEVQHPEPTFRDVVQKLQYGDPEEAAAELERLVDSRAGKVANQGQLQRSYDQDLARSQKALAAFTAANPDLASDEIAALAIERGMYKLYEEDMVKLGLDRDQLPKTPKELANWHRFYRINGYEVRPTTELLNESKKGFLKWRDGAAPGKQRQTPSRQQQPRVRVNVDRDQRRMAIPTQPTRGVTPRRDAPTTSAARGSDVVAEMRRQRGQI